MCNVSVDYGKKNWEKAVCMKNGRCSTRRFGDTARKTIPYEFTVMGLDAGKASELFIAWVGAAEECGADRISESEFECVYDEGSSKLTVRVSYPKDFDQPIDVQRNGVRTILRRAARKIAPAC